ncbi:MAG: hypothetical protein OQK73_02000 [Gammaproteobacteria bacterium]|nr:hypothetical protein [Gammaproteobacteria bacterium]
MNNSNVLPLYEVKELSLEEVILGLATEQEKFQTEYQEASARFLQMYAA